MQPLTPTTTTKHNPRKQAFIISIFFVAILLIGLSRTDNQLQETQEKLNNHICNNINATLWNMETEPTDERILLESLYFKH